MEITLNVNLTASPELLDALKALFSKPAAEAKPEAPVKSINGTKVKADAKTEAKASSNGEKITIEKVRAAVTEKSQQNGKREAIKGILTDFGTDRVTNLKEEQYPEFLTKVNAL